MSEQFCLRWNNHQSTLISVFETLLESGSLIDCTLCAEGQLLKGHKVVLSACSPIFESMLCIQEDKHPIIFLKDVKFIELKAMLDYMYKGEVNILQDQLDSFLRTAAALQIKGLTDQGGGGGDEPPAKKGPGRKTGMSDAPESPLVGNAPLREGSVSPTRRRRRLPRRPSSAEDASADNCDIPPPAVAPPAITPATQAPLPVVESLQRSSLTVKAKQEPIDTPLVTPKQEFVEETNEEIEDLTLDDDDDYNDSMSDLSKPGTSYGAMNPGSTSQQDFSQWQQMMGAADRSGTDEVFMAAQEAINNQANTQDHQQVQVSDEDNSRQDEAVDAPSITREEVTEILNKIIKLENEVENEKVSFLNNESELEVELNSENKATALSDKELERIFGPPKDVNPTIESVEFVSEKSSKPDVKTTDVWPRLKKLLTDDKFEAVGSGAEVTTSQPSTTTSTFESITKRSINVVPTYTLQEPKVCHRTVSMPVSLPVHFENSPVSRPPPPLTKIRESKVPKQPKGSFVVKKTTSFKAILPKPSKSDFSSSAKNVQSSPRSLVTPSPSKIHVSPSINPSSTSLCPLNKITVSSSPGQSNFTSSQIYLGPTVNPTDLPSQFTPVYANPSTYPTPSISSINSPQIFLTRTMNTTSISRSAANTIPLSPNVPSLPSSSAVSPVRNVTKTTQSSIPNSQTPIVSPIPPTESKIYLDKPIITTAKVRKRTIQIVRKPPWSRI